MTRSRRLPFALSNAVALTLAFLPTTVSLAVEPTDVASQPSAAELQAQIKSLQEKVNQLETRNSGPSVAETNRIVEAVLRDAEKQSRLFSTQTGLYAGHEAGKFFLRSEDGSFLLQPGLLAQFRNVTNFAEDAKSDGSDAFQNGFEFRRLRFRFDGNAFTKDLTYSVVFDTERNAGDVLLLDAWALYRFAPEWAVRAGQFKEAGFHERDVSSTAQLTVERSIADALIGGAQTDRVQGVALVYGGTKENAFRAELALHDGANSRNTDFRDGATKFGVGGRAEFKAFGEWGNYKDFTAKGTKSELLVFGAGFDHTDRDTRSGTLFTVDAQYETVGGLALYGALQGNYFDERSATAADDSRFQWGGLVQAGYLFTPNWEGFARYSLVVLDEDFVDDNQYSEITVGGNYYFGKDGAYLHRLKLTVDVGYLPNGAPQDVTGIGVIQSDGDEFFLRAQMQVQL